MVEFDEKYDQAREVHPQQFSETSSAINQFEEEWNPRLHLVLHSMVLKQIEEVEAVETAYNQLQEEYGLHSHSAIHALSAVLGEEIFEMLNQRKEFDSEAHQQELDKLLNPNSTPFQDYVEPLQHGDPPEHPEIE